MVLNTALHLWNGTGTYHENLVPTTSSIYENHFLYPNILIFEKSWPPLHALDSNTTNLTSIASDVAFNITFSSLTLSSSLIKA